MIDHIKVASLLNTASAVAVMPTDTVYGLVARATDKKAVSRLYGLKDRQNKPGTLLALDINQLVELGFKRKYIKAVEQFWPGPVSVVIPVEDPNLDYLTLGLVDIAVRIPNDSFVSNVLELTGPLITTSANLPAQLPATNINEAKNYFGDQVDAYFDGGDLSNHLPSTIIRVIDDQIDVIRQGAVIIDSI